MSPDSVYDPDLVVSLQNAIMEQGIVIHELQDRLDKLEKGFRLHLNDYYAHKI